MKHVTEILSRDEFRESVFQRDGYKCVVCGNKAQDAHHIMERRLFPDGGYYLDNGASVCGECHIKCEQTLISPDKLRELAKINRVVLPEHMYHDQVYDKWGNIIQQNGTRLKGELFFDESVQKILKAGGVLSDFTDLIKYPRTHHLPFSPGMHDDDRVIESLDFFKDRRIIVTEKLDGENTTMYQHALHARSVDSQNHPSRNWVKNFWGNIRWDIPNGWRICGENMYQVHSIKYDDLKSYFYGFSIWNEKNECLSWDDTIDWFQLLGITPVRCIYDGTFDEKRLKDLSKSLDTNKIEGFVIRTADEFSYGSFRKCVAKWVRENHIRTVKHWMHGQAVEQNTLETNNGL